MNEIVVKKQTQLATVIAVALVVGWLDQLSKYWVVSVAQMGSRPPIVLNDYMAIVMAWNKGISFSMLTFTASYMPYVWTGLAVVVSALLLRLAFTAPSRLERIAYAMVAGGALSNALDRLRFGAVADFFYVHLGPHGWPAFNLADSAICVGVGLLILSLMKSKARP